MTSGRSSLGVLVLILVLVACSQVETPMETPVDTSITNNELDIQLSALPEGFEVSVNEGLRFEFRPVDETEVGELRFSVGPEVNGVNLVAAVKGHQAQIEALPEGNYKGAQELQGPLGTAFYSRGRFVEEGIETEETILMTIHPNAQRMLSITYRYPAGDDSGARVEQVINALAVIE